MVIVVEEHNVSSAIRELQEAGETVWRVGRLVERTENGCVIENMDTWA